MASAEFAGDAAGFFAASGWQQFFLNEQFTISLPCNSLAELCKLAPENLKGSLFIDLVSPPDKDKLQRRLLQLETTPNQPISSMMLALLENGLRELPVEIMLYPAPKNNVQISYTGFIRPVPGTVTEFLAEKIGRQLGFKHKQAERVAQLGRHITAILDLGTLLDYVVKSLSQDFGYHYTSIFLVDDNETTLTLEAVSGMPMDATDQLNLVVDNQTIVGHAASTARPIQVNTALLNAAGGNDADETDAVRDLDVTARAAPTVVQGTGLDPVGGLACFVEER